MQMASKTIEMPNSTPTADALSPEPSVICDSLNSLRAWLVLSPKTTTLSGIDGGATTAGVLTDNVIFCITGKPIREESAVAFKLDRRVAPAVTSPTWSGSSIVAMISTRKLAAVTRSWSKHKGSTQGSSVENWSRIASCAALPNDSSVESMVKARVIAVALGEVSSGGLFGEGGLGSGGGGGDGSGDGGSIISG